MVTHFLLPTLVAGSLYAWLASPIIVIMLILDLAATARTALELDAAPLSLVAVSRTRAPSGR